MASSDPAGGADTAGVAAAPSSGEPPPPSSSSSSKRRWSPCTWRYAIEDAQPELGSRPRSNSNPNPLFSASSLRAASSSEHAAHPPTASGKSRLHPSAQDQAYGKDQPDEPPRRSAYPNRTWGGVELSELRARQAQPRGAHDTLSRKKRPPHPQSNHQQQQKEPVKRQSPKGEEEEEEEEEEEVEEDDDDNNQDGDGDDAELRHHFEEGKKRKKREMSPSELYYCEICRARVEAAKGTIVSGSPPPPSEES